MSSIVGEPDDFIDTQGFAIKFKEPDPSSDTTEFRQTLSITPAKVEHNVDFNSLTSDEVEKLFSLTDAAFEVIMMVTQPELVILTSLSLLVNAQLPLRLWTITMTSVSGNSTTIEGVAGISKLSIVDAGVGFSTIEMTLDFVSSAAITGVLSVT